VSAVRQQAGLEPRRIGPVIRTLERVTDPLFLPIRREKALGSAAPSPWTRGSGSQPQDGTSR
jgi:hypothetical protein